MRPQCVHEATELAEELCRQLGPGWEPRVWQNIRLCYSARYPLPGGVRAEVHPSALSGQYTAYLHHQFVAHGDTPRAALDGAMQEAAKELSKITTVFEALSQVPT